MVKLILPLSLVTIQMQRKLCLLPRLKLWWRFFIDVNKWISLVWINFFFIPLFPAPSREQPAGISFLNFPLDKLSLPLSLVTIQMERKLCLLPQLKLWWSFVIDVDAQMLPYSVTPGDQLCTYPVTFAKLNQTSALKFLLHACKFLTLLIIAS